MGPDRRATELQDDTSTRLLVLSAGRIETIFRIIEQAALHAIEGNSFKVHHEHLVRAIDEFETRERRTSIHGGPLKRQAEMKFAAQLYPGGVPCDQKDPLRASIENIDRRPKLR